jgi:hypothetical protein
MEVEMKFITDIGAVAVMSLGLGVAMSAHAAPFTLTCDAARSGAVAIQLTGFSVVVTGSGENVGVTGKGEGRRDAKFALTVQTDSGKDYETLLSMLEDGEVLRSCKLVDGQGGRGVAANDSWTQESVKGKNKGKNSAPASNTGGALEWILTNASVTSLTATGGPNSTGAPTTSMQATIEAQTFSFAM